MKRRGFLAVLGAAVLALALIAPTAAVGLPSWILDRSLIGVAPAADYRQPDVSGNHVVMQRRVLPATLYDVVDCDLRTGAITVIGRAEGTYNADEPAIDGPWIVWQIGADIRAKNIATGVVRRVTNDGAATPANLDLNPRVSGDYVVWARQNGTDWDIKGRNLKTMSPSFFVAGGPGNQVQPSIHGKRVAYVDVMGPAGGQVKVKTIGGGTKTITSIAPSLNSPDIGDHLIVWRVPNTSGKQMFRYFDYDTGQTHDGKSSTTVDVMNPQVSGDRILFEHDVGPTADLFIGDVRLARSGEAVFSVPDNAADEAVGRIGGNTLVYLVNGKPWLGKIAVPSLSINKLPKRIAHGGRIRLKGTLKDQGIPIGHAALAVEKYSSGKWVKIKTLTTTASGTYSYRSGKLYSKRKLRVAYDGKYATSGPHIATHLSKVSSVRTAWPR